MTELPSFPLLGSPRRREATASAIETVYRARASEFLRVATPQRLPRSRLPAGLTRSNTRLYRGTFDLLRTTKLDRAGRHTLFVYLSRSAKLGVWRVVWVATKP